MGKKIILSSYMVPSIPLYFYSSLCEYLQEKLSISITLKSGFVTSGPTCIGDFTSDDINLAFICSPSYFKHQEKLKIIAVPVPNDERCKKRPVYFSNIIMRKEDLPEMTKKFKEDKFLCLKNLRWAFNDNFKIQMTITERKLLKALPYLKNFMLASTFNPF
eukprot:TRINITY_DN9605_c0_g1_i1.p1 TRINITY_DN9605_c0_g1~~TRINITY_DN9605_c0_g1_i1.p1  ORF type:complete len:161 (+),score=26.44 TRINITY_DN9605_c0_g1_i1:3-485(+)